MLMVAESPKRPWYSLIALMIVALMVATLGSLLIVASQVGTIVIFAAALRGEMMLKTAAAAAAVIANGTLREAIGIVICSLPVVEVPRDYRTDTAISPLSFM